MGEGVFGVGEWLLRVINRVRIMTEVSKRPLCTTSKYLESTLATRAGELHADRSRHLATLSLMDM